MHAAETQAQETEQRQSRLRARLKQQLWHCAHAGEGERAHALVHSQPYVQLDESMRLQYARALARAGYRVHALALARQCGFLADRVLAAVLHQSRNDCSAHIASAALAVAASLRMNQVERLLVPELQLACSCGLVRSVYLHQHRYSQHPQTETALSLLSHRGLAVEHVWFHRCKIASGLHAHSTRVLAHTRNHEAYAHSRAVAALHDLGIACQQYGQSWSRSAQATLALNACVDACARARDVSSARYAWDFAVDDCGIEPDQISWAALARAEASEAGSDSIIEAILPKAHSAPAPPATHVSVPHKDPEAVGTVGVLNALLTRKARDGDAEGVADVASRMQRVENGSASCSARALNMQLQVLADVGDVKGLESLIRSVQKRSDVHLEPGMFAPAFKGIAVAAENADAQWSFRCLKEKLQWLQQTMATELKHAAVPHSLSTLARAHASLRAPEQAYQRAIDACQLVQQRGCRASDAEKVCASVLQTLVRNGYEQHAQKLWAYRKQVHSSHLFALAPSVRAVHALVKLSRSMQKSRGSAGPAVSEQALAFVQEARSLGTTIDAACATELLYAAMEDERGDVRTVAYTVDQLCKADGVLHDKLLRAALYKATSPAHTRAPARAVANVSVVPSVGNPVR